MSSTFYVDLQGPPVNAAWLNDVNNLTYNLLGTAGAASTTAAEILIALGATALGITTLQAGTGAVARALQDKLRDTVSVMDFMTVAQIADVQSNAASIDATASIQAAATSLVNGGTLLFPPGTYLVLSQVTLPSDVAVIGYGATLQLSTTTAFTGGALYTTGANVVIEGLSFDLGFTRCPTYSAYPAIQNCGIYGYTATNLKVINCNFSNLYTVAVQYYTSDTIEVRGCQFSSPAQTQQIHLEFIWLLTISGRNAVENCSFTNAGVNPATGVCAVFGSGTIGPVTIRNCWTNNCSRDNTGTHRLETFAFYGNSVDVHVEDNFCFNNLSAWLRLADCGRVRVFNNYASVIVSGAATDTALLNSYGTTTYAGIGQAGLQDIQIVGNFFVNPSPYTGRSAITLGSQDFSVPTVSVLIANNNFNNFHINVNIYGPLMNVRVERNMSRSVNGGEILFEYGNLTIGAAGGVTEAQSLYDGIYINDNYSQDTGSSNLNGITVDMTKTPEYLGTLGQIEINRNRVEATVGNTGPGISVRGVNLTNVTRTVFRGNEVTGYGVGYYPRFSNEVTVEQNKARSCTIPFLQSNNGSINQSLNRYSVGPYSGQITLVAGTKTVLTPEVMAGDSIFLTNVAVGGAAGFLNVGAIVAGTSFVIHSSNGSDASTIFWQIMH